jgi:AraC-like DNA-binding protein
MENFEREINLQEIANIANLNASAFCRFFKAHTLKTLSQVINEIRVSYACKLISETDESISEICFKSGYNYLSNFYKQFEKIKKTAPGNYRKAIQRNTM